MKYPFALAQQRRDNLSRRPQPLVISALALAICSHVNADTSKQKIEEVTVIGAYSATASEALGFDLSPQAVPATINILPSDLWQVAGARTLDDMLQFVPGVNLNDNGGWTGDALVIRGFAATLPFRDGMRSVNSYGQSLRAMSDNIERVEIIKGPSATDFGVAEPGGVINFVTKKPQIEHSGSGTVKIGEDGYRRFSVDTTGAMVASEALQGLLVLAYEEPPEWRMGRPDNTHRYLIAPSVNWDINNKASLLFAYEKQYQKSPQDRGIIYLENAWPGGFAPRDWSFHQTSSNQENETDRFSLTTKVEINSALELTAILEHQKYRYNLQEFRNAETEPDWGDLYQEDGRTWSGERITNLFWSDWKGDIPASSAKVFLDYTLGNHTLKFGYDNYFSKAKNTYASYTIDNTLDILAPVNNQQPNILSYDGTSSDVLRTEESGFSLRWLGEWTPRFRTVVGARRFDFEYEGYGDYEATKTSLRLSASYDLNSSHTLFIGLSDGYVPQAGEQRYSAVEPLHDKAAEIGVKSQFLNGQIQWTNSVYQTNRDNLTVADPTNSPTESFLINAGKAEIRGFESELTGELTSNWSVRLGIALMDSEIVENEVAEFEGNRFGNTPDHQIALLTSYSWGDIGIGELSTDFGVTRIGYRWGDAGNTVKLPAYHLVNLGANLEPAENWRINITATNLTDETYYTGMQFNNAARADQVMVGNIRNISLSATYKY